VNWNCICACVLNLWTWIGKLSRWCLIGTQIMVFNMKSLAKWIVIESFADRVIASSNQYSFDHRQAHHTYHTSEIFQITHWFSFISIQERRWFRMIAESSERSVVSKTDSFFTKPQIILWISLLYLTVFNWWYRVLFNWEFFLTW